MALYYVPGQGIVDSSQEGVSIPEYGELVNPWTGEVTTWGDKGVYQLPQYTNPYQYGREDASFQWDPQQGPGYRPAGGEGNIGYGPALISLADRVASGQATDLEREEYEGMRAAALAVPMRDPASLRGDYRFAGDSADPSGVLDLHSPDLGAMLLTLRDKRLSGTATPQENDLYQTFLAHAQWQDYQATVPQASDAFSLLGNDLFGPMMTLAMGATGGLAGGALAAGGLGLGSTLGSLGTLASVAGTGAGVIGQATDQDWLTNLGLGLGIAGGVAGGLGGLSSLWSSGVSSLSDAAKLASSAGKITGSLGRIPGAGPLKDVSRYLGYAGQAGNLGSSLGADDWLGWGGTNSPLAANVAPSNVQNLLSAADVATQRGGGGMEWDYSNDWGASAPYDNWSWDAGATAPGGGFTPDYSYDYGGQQPYDNWSGSGGAGGLSLEDQVRQAIAGRPDLYGSASSPMSGLGSVLGSIGSFLGKNAGLLGPAASALGSLGGGAIGSNAANEAARLQAAALNRGIDLSTSQWLEQLARTQPWVSAGQQALGTLQGLAGQQLPGLPGATPGISGANYAMPGTTPGWNPQLYQGPQGPNAGDFSWNPQAGPQAANFRYTPGAVPTLSGQELLANDPGVAFRLAEGRKALEGSAAARGGLLSGPTLAALQRQGQELSSQEYGQAWNRASQQAQLREQWNQMASQMGWSQAESEARFREQMAQQAGAQNWTQALQGQQNLFNQGLDTSKWNTLQQQQYAQEQYKNMLEQSKWRYGTDVAQNTTDYDRAQQLYRQQLAQHLLPWEQNSTIAQLGGQITGQLGSQGIASSSGISNLLGQLGSTQAMGTLGSAGQWNTALAGGVGGLQNILRGLNA